MAWVTPLAFVIVVGLLVNVLGTGLGGPGGLLNGPVSTTASDGTFDVTLKAPKRVWVESEAIEITGSLTYRGPNAATDISHGHRTPLGFSIVEPVNGMALSMGWRASCEPSTLVRDVPLSKPFGKTGGFSNEDPAAEQYRAWFADPQLRLPVGTWHIYVLAKFSDGRGCGAPHHDIRAEIEIEVVTASGIATTSPPSTSPTASSAIESSVEQDGFRLTVRSAKDAYVDGEPIDVVGTLTYLGPDASVTVHQADAPAIFFNIRPSPTGDDVMAVAPGCIPLVLERDKPITRPFAVRTPINALTKSSVGSWEIVATTGLHFATCDGPKPILTTSISIRVMATGPAPTTAAPAARAVDIATDGPYTLEIHANRTVYQESDAINVWAALRYAADAPQITIAHAGLVPLGFGIAERVYGLDLEPTWETRCTPRLLAPDARINRAFERTAGFGALEDDQREFLEDPDLHLPPGRWHLSAVAWFEEGDCLARGREVRLQVEIEITVLPDPLRTPAPSDSSMVEIELMTAPSARLPDGTKICMAAAAHGILARNPVTGLGFAASGEVEAVGVVWPEGYTAAIEDGVATLRTAGGLVVAREGDVIDLGGGYQSNGLWRAC